MNRFEQVAAPGHVAVITGGASGIGLASAKALAARGMTIVIADLAGPALDAAVASLAGVVAGGAENCRAVATDVASLGALEALREATLAAFGRVDLVMNNAGVQPGSALFGPFENWEKVFAVNLLGVIHGSRAFAPGMIAAGTPGMIINTGSKQGITTPPGDPAYNVAKAGVKAFTEALEHDLRNTAGADVSAHLLIPGFVFTGLTKRDRMEKPAGAWMPEQTADFMLASLARGDFYILCPDNDVPRALDEKRIAWAAGDIIENRPPLSRWHKDFGDRFKAFLEGR